MDIAPITSQRDYCRILKEVEGLMSARRHTLEGDRLDILVMRDEAWERSIIRWTYPNPLRRSKRAAAE